MRAFILIALTLAVASGQFFNPFSLFGGRGNGNRRPPPPPGRPASRPAPSRPAPFQGGSSGGRCTNGFHVSSNNLSWQAAQNYCSRNGFRRSSLDTQAKINTAYNLVRPLKYFWTGGETNHGRRTARWPNGRETTPDWSFTGG